MTAPVTQPDAGTATALDDDAIARLSARAYDAFDAGDLPAARADFEALLAAGPAHSALHYMLGLIAKYQRDWVASQQHNLCALPLYDDPADAEAAHWNAAIAATALGDHDEARRQWAACGIELPAGDGAIERHFGVAGLRLDAWDRGETVFARRIDPVRACIINVPLPDGGHRYGDIVLHDGAAAGERLFHQSRVPVFNALQRLHASEFHSYAVFVRCTERDALAELLDLRVPGIGAIEDWTDSISHLCLRCSYGAPHDRSGPGHGSHDTQDRPRTWHPERNLGVAAQGRVSVQRLLERWKAGGPGRWLDAIESRDATPSDPPASGTCWWRSPGEPADA